MWAEFGISQTAEVKGTGRWDECYSRDHGNGPGYCKGNVDADVSHNGQLVGDRRAGIPQVGSEEL